MFQNYFFEILLNILFLYLVLIAETILKQVTAAMFLILSISFTVCSIVNKKTGKLF